MWHQLRMLGSEKIKLLLPFFFLATGDPLNKHQRWVRTKPIIEQIQRVIIYITVKHQSEALQKSQILLYKLVPILVRPFVHLFAPRKQYLTISFPAISDKGRVSSDSANKALDPIYHHLSIKINFYGQKIQIKTHSKTLVPTEDPSLLSHSL